MFFVCFWFMFVFCFFLSTLGDRLVLDKAFFLLDCLVLCGTYLAQFYGSERSTFAACVTLLCGYFSSNRAGELFPMFGLTRILG